jgi:hypothetical protein
MVVFPQKWIMFFALIKNAAEELNHPASFYGTGFIYSCLVFAMVLKQKILRRTMMEINQKLLKP